MKIQSTENVKTQKIKTVIYGQSGAGKTSLAATLEKVLLISAESGTLSLAGKKVDFVDISRDDEGKTIVKENRISRLLDVYKWIQTEEAKTKYDTIMIDSLTEIGQCMIDRIAQDYPDAKDNFKKWGDYGSKMRDLIKAFRDLPDYNVVFTAIAINDKDDNGRRYFNIDLQGSIGDKLPAYFDLVLYLHVDGEGQRHIITRGTDKLIAKDRSGKLSPIEEATLGGIFRKILT